MDAIRDLIRRLWDDYAAINPQAAAIHALLAGEGEEVVNDHIALRTWGEPRVGGRGARPALRARGLPRGRALPASPRSGWSPATSRTRTRRCRWCFISELVLGACSRGLQDMVHGLLAQVPAEVMDAPDLAARGRPWAVSFAAVEGLRAESEYAAWLAAFGWRANHFTVSVNALRRRGELAQLNAFLKGHGFAISPAGGEIKGSPAQGLEQSSTLASAAEVAFTDGVHAVPGCYYEFARRHAGPDGRLFRGFIEGSADRIFESTDRGALSGG